MRLLILILFFWIFFPAFAQERISQAENPPSQPSNKEATPTLRQEMLQIQAELVDLIVLFKDTARLFARLNGELEGLSGSQQNQIRQLQRSKKDLARLKLIYKGLGTRLVQLQTKIDVWLKRTDIDQSFRDYLMDAKKRCKGFRKQYDKDQENLSTLPELLDMRLKFIRLQSRPKSD